MGFLAELVSGPLNGAAQQREKHRRSSPTGDKSLHYDDSPLSTRAKSDKIKCLDGLRGIACFIVFNYHFLWPWTPLIMLGYGARPPRSLEPYAEYSQLPIICLTHRGRPMVAIFFAISGYVLCRHVLRSIQKRHLEAAYKALASAVFRRAFRLYIPPTISLFLVAMLAQMGVFKPEYAIYKGPDSIYINGTKGAWPGHFGANGSMTLNSTMGLSANGSMHHHHGAHRFNATWIKLGGMWEEHPIIHPNMTTALSNFTAVYAEWANPFTWDPRHPRLDPHAYTIPMEFRGSMVLYTLLLGTAALKASWRLSIAGYLAIYCLIMGRWEVATFLGGMIISELDVLRTSSQTDPILGDPNSVAKSRRRSAVSPGMSNILHYVLLFSSLYLLSYPDSNAAFTPGFRTLSSLTPRHYAPSERWRFHQSIGALLLLPCVMRSPFLRRVLEGRIPQYLGKISFSFYLVHGPVLHSMGFWIMPRLFDQLGKTRGFVVGWFILAGVSLYLARVWYRKVDVWSVGVGKRVERYMVRQ
ncbi:acyltransferase 3 [Pseudomassariella vexata]|uniref:Acyltransferase 3 n=1 Tax=Pseudomassariella vexata TaxID=1141098 RepID=A0A1Y2DK07_9PEZI|nr:acyltransferase 3 [Pseudomassariella vexata]ORY59115.1 acyltransferase 3 [Pseudomassariella vexata]